MDNIFDDDSTFFDTETTETTTETTIETQTQEGGVDPTDDQDYFELFKQLNVLDLPEDYEFTSIESALEDTRSRLAKKAETSLLDSVSPDLAPLIEFALKGGNSLDEYLQYTRPVDLRSLDASTEEGQRKILTTYYSLTSSYTPEKIESLVNRLEASGALEEEAQTAIADIEDVLKTRQKEVTENLKKQEELEIENTKKRIESINDELLKSKFSTDRTNRIKSFIFTPTTKGTTQLTDTLSNIYENPSHFVTFVNLLADYEPTKGFNFDQIKKTIKTEGVSSIRQIIQEKIDPKLKSSKGSVQKKVEDNFDWDAFFNKN